MAYRFGRTGSEERTPLILLVHDPEKFSRVQVDVIHRINVGCEGYFVTFLLALRDRGAWKTESIVTIPFGMTAALIDSLRRYQAKPQVIAFVNKCGEARITLRPDGQRLILIDERYISGRWGLEGKVVIYDEWLTALLPSMDTFMADYEASVRGAMRYDDPQFVSSVA